MELDALPGADLVEAGIADLLLVSIGALRLRRAGIDVPAEVPDPGDKLYALLAETDPDSAHSRHNALIRRLVRFERAAECAVR